MTENTSEAGNEARILYEACPLCAAKEISDLLKADCTKHPLYDSILGPVISWKKCAACAHVFTDGYFTEAAANILFSKTNENQKVGADMERQRHVSARMIEKVLPFAQQGGGGHWLDIGFGNASLLFTAQEYGFTPVGIDLRETNTAALKHFGIEAHCLDVAKLDHPGRYTVISLADVLEHAPYPKDVLNAVHKLLKKDGLTLLSMPNTDAPLWHAMTKANANPYWSEIEHYHNFGRERLYRLLEECGFRALRYGVSERYRVCMEVVAGKI